MFICPICAKEIELEELAAKHLLTCWREQNPFHKSKEAPHSADIEVRTVNNELMSFFTERKNNAGSKN